MALSDSLMTSAKALTQPRRRATVAGIVLGVVVGASVGMCINFSATPLSLTTQRDQTLSELEIVQEAFDTWLAGGYNGPSAMGNLGRLWSRDAVFDFTANINEPLYKVYHGRNELINFFQSLVAVKYENFKPIIFKGSNGAVMAKTSYFNVFAATGAEGVPQSDILEFRVRDSKITYCKVFHGNQKQMSELWASETMGPVKASYNAWSLGQLQNPTTVRQFFAEDVMVDATANVMATDKYKMYAGIDGVVDWATFLTSFDFANFVPKFFPGPAPDIVIAEMSYGMTYKPTGKSTVAPMSDLLVYKVVDQKIVGMKFFWGQPAVIDQIMQ